MEPEGKEHRANHPLSDEDIEAIAERAAERALKKVYEEVGRSTVRFALWIVGAGVIALFSWLAATGKIGK